MFCFVDFRNRPQCKYAFPSRQSAREYFRKIQNNSLGATVFHADGRREYFENGLPGDFARKNIRIKRGCHIKYKIRALSAIDGIAPSTPKENVSTIRNWSSKSASPLFMLGNLKFSACLLIVALTAFSFSYIFQKNFGQPATAGEIYAASGTVLGAEDSRVGDDGRRAENDFANGVPQLADEEVILNLIGKIDEKKHESFEKEILQYIKGKPMESMAPYIARQPRIVAAFIVGIAMKESKFGIYAPHDANGRDCNNYWGYRGPENTTASGYSCFSSPEHAIQVVGKKINKLVAQGISNPAEMISWKCGSTCAGHGAEDVRKWIADVGVNFYKLNSKGNS